MCSGFLFVGGVVQLYDFQIFNLLAVDDKPHQCAHLMEAVPACRTRVDVQASDSRVVHHFQQMRVTRNEEPRRMRINLATDAGIVFAGIAPNVLHQHIHLLTLPPIGLRESDTDIAAVDVAIHRTQWSDFCQSVSHFHDADVARVPNFIAVLEMLCIAFVPTAMRVRKQPYASHPATGSSARCSCCFICVAMKLRT